MNIITLSNSTKSKTIKRRGTIKESLAYIAGWLSALNDRGVDVETITISHKYINSAGRMTDHSTWRD